MPKDIEKLEDKLDKMSLMIAENFAVIKTDISYINAHLKTLNGKVADHVNQIQELREKAITLDSAVINITRHEDKEDEKRDKFHFMTWDKALTVASSISVAYILFKIGIN